MRTKLLAAVGAALILSGCAGSVGTVTPVSMEAELVEGQVVTVIAYETKGIQWTNGYAIVGGNGSGSSALEGGNISDNGGGVITGTVEAIARILGALLSPFGAASAALSENVEQ